MSTLKESPYIQPNINGNTAPKSTFGEPNGLSATLRVFRIPELIELIFSHLDPDDLLHRVTPVCRNFKQMIASSPGLQQRLAFCILVDDENPTVPIGLVPKGMKMSSGVTGWRLETHMQYFFQCDWTTGSSSYYTFTELRYHAEFRRLRIELGSTHALELSWTFNLGEDDFALTIKRGNGICLVSESFTLGEIFDIVADSTAEGTVECVNMRFMKVDANGDEALASHRRGSDG